MNVATITMDPEEAKAKLRAYRKELHRQADGEYDAAVLGYKALGEGFDLVDLGEVFRACPVDEKGRPRLAIAMADAKQVRVSIRETETQAVFDCNVVPGSWRRVRERSVRTLTIGSPTPKTTAPGWNSLIEGWALVPMIPADVLPARGSPEQWHILWEVEKWSDTRIGQRPDRDPLLLRHLGGNLYSILAAWDLTDLERAVMAKRADVPR